MYGVVWSHVSFAADSRTAVPCTQLLRWWWWWLRSAAERGRPAGSDGQPARAHAVASATAPSTSGTAPQSARGRARGAGRAEASSGTAPSASRSPPSLASYALRFEADRSDCSPAPENNLEGLVALSVSDTHAVEESRASTMIHRSLLLFLVPAAAFVPSTVAPRALVGRRVALPSAAAASTRVARTPHDGGRERSRTAGDGQGEGADRRDLGRAGGISYGAFELLFWVVSVPIASFAFIAGNGHVPDMSNVEDAGKVSAWSLGFITLARFAVPFRIGIALALAPWVDENVCQRFGIGGRADDVQLATAQLEGEEHQVGNLEPPPPAPLAPPRVVCIAGRYAICLSRDREFYAPPAESAKLLLGCRGRVPARPPVRRGGGLRSERRRRRRARATARRRRRARRRT